MIRATAVDVPAVVTCLSQDRARAMFPLSNLENFGFEGSSNHAPSFWYAARDGRVTDVLTISKGGMVMPFLPSHDFQAAAKILKGRDVIGVIGARDWARNLEQAAGMNAFSKTLNRDELHLALDLGSLQEPEGVGALRDLVDAPRETILEWMRQYQIEALETSKAEAEEHAARSYRRYCEAGSHKVLMDGEMPLAMTGFNAQLPRIVQIGGVFTPMDLRGRGHARRALALHLDQVRAAGVTHATLFSAGDAARRAYEAIGFRWFSDWTLLLFDGPQHV